MRTWSWKSEKLHEQIPCEQSYPLKASHSNIILNLFDNTQ